MNQRSHWDGIGNNYNHEIFDVFKSDKNKRLPFYFKKHSGPQKTAMDFGCGNGKSFSYLSPFFKHLWAIDISQQLLNQAKQRPFENISLKRMDLSGNNLKLPKVDFIFCCNVIMLPELTKNVRMFKNVSRALKKGGSAVLVLPAMESILFASWRLIDWYKREGVAPKDIDRDELNYFKGSKTDILQGLVHIDNVPTKHYLASELHVLLAEAGLTITALDKVEYRWDTEFQSPPNWIKAPYPWDWLVECRKS